jgi:hypothetical protein
MTKSDTYTMWNVTDKGQNCVSRMGNAYKIVVDYLREEETQKIYVYTGG